MPRLTYFLPIACLLLFSLVSLAYLHSAQYIQVPLVPTSWRTAARPIITFTPSPSQSENRQLTTAQCLATYPQLYLEADRARVWYDRKGGISEEMVDQAEQDGASARLAILDNKVCLVPVPSGDPVS